MSEEAGAWEIVTQMMSAIPRILIIALIILFVVFPIGCYVNRRDETKDFEGANMMNSAVNCVKKYDLLENDLLKCFNHPQYGLKISKGEKIIVLHEEIYNQKNKPGYTEVKETIEKKGDKINLELIFIPNE